MGVSRVSIPSHDTKSPARKLRRWVGLGVIADNVIHIGTHLAGHARSG